MTTAEKAELVLKVIIDAAMKGHQVKIWLTDEEEFNSDRWLAIESPGYLCLSSPPGEDKDWMIHKLAEVLLPKIDTAWTNSDCG